MQSRYGFIEKLSEKNAYAELRGFTKSQVAYVKKKANDNGIQLEIARGRDGIIRAVRTN